MRKKNLLLGIDLEDVRDQIPDGTRYEDRMQVNVDRILTFLRAKNAFATFFTVGSVARRLPDLLSNQKTRRFSHCMQVAGTHLRRHKPGRHI